MKKTGIKTVYKQLPDVFSQRPFKFDEEWVSVPIHSDAEESEFENYIFGSDSLIAENNFSRTTDFPEAADFGWPGHSTGILERSRLHGEEVSVLGSPGVRKYTPSPDAYGFYLPWHYYSVDIWGIYLVVEYLEKLARDVAAKASPVLSVKDASHVARTFVFHHEAYHNAVETFAARLEIAHRAPFYRTGLAAMHKAPFGTFEVHEETLATAYALEKVRTQAFKSEPMAIRSEKRRISFDALLKIVGAMPPTYREALTLIGVGKLNEKKFLDGQNYLQEHSLRLGKPGAPTLDKEIWQCALYSMGPSLQKNKRYSYLIHRSNPKFREILEVRGLSVKRREFLRVVQQSVGGTLVAGGKHPHWRTRTGHEVAIPTGTDLNPVTAQRILKQLGVMMPLRQFLQT